MPLRLRHYDGAAPGELLPARERSHTSPSELYADLVALADGELLLPWTADLPAVSTPLVQELEAAGLLFTYRAGRPRYQYAYLVGQHQPGDTAGPGSAFPPPSIQAAPTWTMYARRDRNTCHLCYLPVVCHWKRPAESRSLDHLIPRSRGGSDYPSNIRIAHLSCNIGRRDRDAAEFRGWLAARRVGRTVATASGKAAFSGH